MNFDWLAERWALLLPLVLLGISLLSWWRFRSRYVGRRISISGPYGKFEAKVIGADRRTSTLTLDRPMPAATESGLTYVIASNQSAGIVIEGMPDAPNQSAPSLLSASAGPDTCVDPKDVERHLLDAMQRKMNSTPDCD